MRLGGLPLMGTEPLLAGGGPSGAWSSTGPTCTGAPAAWKMVAGAGPYSTALPPYMTRDVIGELGDDPQVVRDDDDGAVELGLQVPDEVEDLRLHGHVEGRRRLVGDEQRRVARPAP